MKNNTAFVPLNITESVYDDIRICYLDLIMDCSGSMKPHEEAVFAALTATLKALSVKVNEDMEYRVKITLFANEVSCFNDSYLAPGDLLTLFTRDSCRCCGGTNLSAIVSHIDSCFSRSSELFAKNIHSGDPVPVTVIITDFVGTDDPDRRSRAMELLSRNRLFREAGKCLCIFCGPEERKADAVALCGDAGNLVALKDSEFASLLAPVMLNSTLNLSDGTHMGCEDLTPSQIAEDAAAREKTGQSGAAAHNDAALRDELRRIFGVDTLEGGEGK